MRPDSEGICFAKQSEQWASSPRSVMSGGVFNRKTPERGKDFAETKSFFVFFKVPFSPLPPSSFFAILLQTFGQDRRTR